MDEKTTKHTTHPPHALSKRQKPTSFIALIVFILLIVGFGGVYLIKSSTLPSQISSEQIACQYDENVCAFLKQLQDPQKYYSGPFTASILTTKPNTPAARVIVKSNEKGSYDIIMYKENVLTGETIIIDNTMYTRDIDTNVWAKAVNTFDPTIRDMKQKAIQTVQKSGPGVTYTLIGDSKCGKKTCYKYEVKTPTSGDTKTYILFTQTQHMLKEIITTSADNTTIDTLFVYSNVDITPPLSN